MYMLPMLSALKGFHKAWDLELNTCVSLLSTRDSCVTCYCNHHFTTGGLLTWNFLLLLHNYSLADLCFTISPSNLNWIVNCFPLFRHTARTILRNKLILHKTRSHMMNLVKRHSEQVFHITENNLAVSNHWMTLHCLLTCETRCTRPNCNNL